MTSLSPSLFLCLQCNDNQIENWHDIEALKNSPRLETVYLDRNPISRDAAYRRKLKLALPTLKQIDATLCWKNQLLLCIRFFFFSLPLCVCLSSLLFLCICWYALWVLVLEDREGARLSLQILFLSRQTDHFMNFLRNWWVIIHTCYFLLQGAAHFFRSLKNVNFFIYFFFPQGPVADRSSEKCFSERIFDEFGFLKHFRWLCIKPWTCFCLKAVLARDATITVRQSVCADAS